MPRLFLVTLVLVVTPLGAQSGGQNPERFSAEIRAFGQWDAKNATPADGILFVGSSTIRLWSTAESFPGLPVINRGFGGSEIPDVNHYVTDTVLKYAPAIVVFYAGDNDISAGRTAERVFEDYRRFVTRVTEARSSTHIVFLAIKPSVDRWKLWPVSKAANEMIRKYSDSRPNLHFVDVATPMLGPGGTMPPARLFVEDGLHMTPEGYALWTRILTPVLMQLRGAAK